MPGQQSAHCNCWAAGTAVAAVQVAMLVQEEAARRVPPRRGKCMQKLQECELEADSFA